MAKQLTITKMDHQRTPRFGYPGDLVLADDDVVVARCVWSGPKPFAVGPFVLELGDVFIEYYYRREWFNILAVYRPTGEFKGWYCNITDPVEIEESVIRWYDLALDLLVLPDGAQIVLDEDEFEALNPDDAIRAQTAEALATLRRWASEKRPPFDGSGRVYV